MFTLTKLFLFLLLDPEDLVEDFIPARRHNPWARFGYASLEERTSRPSVDGLLKKHNLGPSGKGFWALSLGKPKENINNSSTSNSWSIFFSFLFTHLAFWRISQHNRKTETLIKADAEAEAILLEQQELDFSDKPFLGLNDRLNTLLETSVENECMKKNCYLCKRDSENKNRIKKLKEIKENRKEEKTQELREALALKSKEEKNQLLEDFSTS